MSKKTIKVVGKKGIKKKTSYKGKVRGFHIGEGMSSPHQMREELKGYREILHGRADPPIEMGVRTLYEVAEAYFSRACAMEQDILEAQQEGRLAKSGEMNTFRTQELRSYKEMFKSAAELGSRRITDENRIFQQELRGRESM